MSFKEHRWAILVLVAAAITFIAFYLPWVHMTVKDVTPVIEGYDMVSYNVGSDDYRVSGSDLMKQYGKIKLTVVVTKAQVNSAQDVAKIDLLDFSAKKWDAALPQPVGIEGDWTYFGFAVGTILIAALAASSIARPALRKPLMLLAIGIVILMLGLHFWKFYSLQQINDIDETLGRASTNSTSLVSDVVKIDYLYGWMLNIGAFVLVALFAMLAVLQPVPQRETIVQPATSSAP